MKYRLLLVDDEAVNLKLLRQTLKNEYDLTYAKNGEMALELAKQRPHLILLDIMMPRMDGYEVCRHLKSNNETKDIPIIFVTALNDVKDELLGFELGAVDYITKPISPPLVQARVKNHLVMRSAYLFIRNTFGRYLSEAIVDTILDSPDGLALGGEKREVTIMMADLRGFTSISEHLAPENVVKIINSFLGAMTDIILKYGGTIDEFIGDAILVIFGAPIIRHDDPAQAVACALEMQLAMDTLNETNKSLEFPHLGMGVGINTGSVVVGNIGCAKRTKYGVIGQHVNMTSRIESYTVGGQILVSESTLNKLDGNARVDGCMEVMPKGSKKPMVIYDVGGLGGVFDIFLPEKKEIALTVLSQPISIRFSYVESKFVAKSFISGTIVGLAPGAAEIETCQGDTKLLDNLKLSLLDDQGGEVADELYGKVVKSPTKQGQSSLFLFVFTTIPDEAKVFIEQRLAPFQDTKI